MSAVALDGGLRAYETSDDPFTPVTEQHSFPSEDLYTSRHNPDFRTRNHDKIVRIQTILSNFATQLRATSLAKDQPAFDDLFERVTTAGNGFETLKPPQGRWRELKAPEDSEDDARVWPGFTRLGGLWRAEHPENKLEGPCHNQLCRERVVQAKRACRQSRVRQSETLGGMGFFDEDEDEDTTSDEEGEEGSCRCKTPESLDEDATPLSHIPQQSAKGEGQRSDMFEAVSANGQIAEMLADLDLEARKHVQKAGC